MLTRSIAVAAALLATLTASPRAQAPVPQGPAPAASPASDAPVTTLTVATRVVEIAAVVKSKDGQPAGGLAKDDFILKQDGKEEPIRYFSQGSDLPLTLALLVDTSGSQRTFIGDETQASDIFFESMLGRREDRAMLVEFGAGIQLLRPLTPSAAALHLSLMSLSPHASLTGGTLLYDAVFNVASAALARETGRKAIVILSDGGDNGSRHSLADAIEQAQRADTEVYSILYSAANELTPVQRGPTVSSGIGVPLPPPPSGASNLQHLSDSTGGAVFTVSRTLGLREIYARIAEDLRLQYELGYTPPPNLPANSYHRLELRTRDKHLAVQARKGFFAKP